MGPDEFLDMINNLGYKVSTDRVDLKISGMTCAACASRLENTLNRLEGVLRANVNFAMERASIEYDPNRVNIRDLKKAIQGSGLYGRGRRHPL